MNTKPRPLVYRQPDRDVPKIECGYPLPCPHHTVIMEQKKLTIPHHSKAATDPKLRARVKQIHRALKD